MPAAGPLSSLARSPRRLAAAGGGLLVVIAAVVVAVVLSSSSSAPRAASLPAPVQRPRLETIFTEGSAITTDPRGQIALLHALGVDRVRVSFTWGAIAPDPTSPRRPAHFDAADPSAYPAAAWAPYDEIARDLKAHHMGLDLVLAPPPPLWASGPGRPPPTHGDPHPYWKPDPHEFAQFVQALGTRYSGHYTPPGASSPLPREDFWSIWNEPNLGSYLAPEMTRSYSSIEVAPAHYRGLVDAAWTALHATGHGGDTILIGELGPAGSTAAGAPGLYAAMPPLEFLRAMYCVNSAYRQLRGAAAGERGCPTTAAGSARFAAQNPGLFRATGFADHPYSFTSLPPDQRVPNTPDYTNLAAVPTLETALDRVTRLYGSHATFPIWSTEYGNITNPPNPTYTVSPTLAAEYLNWAEYLSWKNPRIRSFDQFLVQDPPPAHPGRPYAGFASGLITYTGQRKPSWYAFRMPVWLPVTTTTAGHPLEVWGSARPARTVAVNARAPAQIQWRAASGAAWRTIASVSTRTAGGYFDVRERFPGSGTVRVRWAPPHGRPMVSRTSPITIR